MHRLPAPEEVERRDAEPALARARRRFAVAVPARSRSAVVPIADGPAAEETCVREGLYRRALATSDAVVAALLVAVVLPALHPGTSPWIAAPAALLVVLVDKARGLYDRDDLVLNKTTLDEAPALVQVAGLFTLILWLYYDGVTAVELDASSVVGLWISSCALLIAGRMTARRLASRLSATERCLIIGEEATIDVVRAKLARVNAEVVASVALDECGALPPDDLLALFRGLARRHRVHRAIIALPASGGPETLDLIRVAKHAGVRVSVLPRMLEVVGSSVEFDHIEGLTMLGVRRFGLTRSSRALKRAFDMGGSTALLIAVAPFMLAIIAAIRLDSRGPIFFRQTRVGRDGRRFQMLKFRSMVPDAEARKAALRHLNETEGLFKIADDPRTTRVGRLLRRSSLDELPQLFNVLRGEMSLVGPRPLVVDEDEKVLGFDRHRLHLTPGMTGHWQILGSSRIPMHEMIGIDYLYVANWSLWTDVKILLRTVPYVLSSRGL